MLCWFPVNREGTQLYIYKGLCIFMKGGKNKQMSMWDMSWWQNFRCTESKVG